MKTLSSLLPLEMLDECDPYQEIHSVMRKMVFEKFPTPVLAKDVVCPNCAGTSGFYIPMEKAWSCRERRCIHYNDGYHWFLKKFLPILPIPPELLFDGDLHISENQKYIPRLSITSIGAPQDYATACLKACDQSKELLDYLKQQAKKPSGYTLLAGNPGTGKTYAACACLDAAIPNGIDNIRFRKTPDLYLEWLDSQEKRSSQVELVTKYADYNLLVLDDFGTRTPSEAFLDYVYLLLDRRCCKSLGTIITTNLNSEGFKQKFGDAIYSRVVSGKVFKVQGQDRRFKDF